MNIFKFFKEKSEQTENTTNTTNPTHEHSKKGSNDFSSSSSSASPQRIYNHYRNRKRLLISLNKDESQDDSNEHDSDIDLTQENFKDTIEEDILYQLIKSIYELCIEVPVE